MSVTYLYETANGLTSATTTTSASNVLVSDNFLLVTSGSTVGTPSFVVSSTDLTHSGTAAAQPDGVSLVYDGGNTVVTVSGVSDSLNGGGAIVTSGGVITSGFVEAGGAIFVVGGTTSSTIVSGGQEYVFSGGLSSAATISAGTQAVYNGGVASSTTLDGGTYQLVYSGGSAVSAAVGGGSDQEIYAGATASVSIVYAGATQTIHAGASASFDQIQGGNAYIYGSATSATVVSSGIEDVMSGGTAVSTTVVSGGTQIVSAGGLGLGVNVSLRGIQDVVSGGVASGSYISGGVVTVESGGSAVNLRMLTTGEIVVNTGGTMTGTVASGGQIEIFGLGSGSVLSGGQELVMGGGHAVGTDIQTNGSEVIMSGGTATNTVLEAGGSVAVYDGGILDNLHVTGAKSVVSLAAGAVVQGDIVLSSTGIEIQFTGTSLPSVKIDGFAAGDSIDLANITGGTSATYANGVLTISGANGVVATIDLGTAPSGFFTVGADTGTGTLVTLDSNIQTASAAVASFTAGTLTNAVAISDSAADISANLSGLESIATAGKLAGISLTDSGVAALSVTAAQLSTDYAVLNDITGNLVLTVDASAASNATITGVTNHATVVSFAGNASAYTVTGSDGAVTVTGSTIGTDHLSNVTMLKFADFTEVVASATPISGATLSAANVAELYAATLDREPDAAGLYFYENLIKTAPATSFVTVASYFMASSEYTSSHNYAATTAGDAQFISDLYTNLLHRTGSSTEIAYYQTIITQTGNDLTGRAQVLSYFSASPEFHTNVQITGTQGADAHHWLVLV